MTTSKNLCVPLVLFLLLCAVGCGQNARVTGKITFTNGEPLTIGRVVFSSSDGSYQVSGQINQEGMYKLDEIKPGSGIKPGDYGVTILQAAHVEYGSGKTAVSLIHPKYESPETSALKATVEKRKSLVYNITVEPPPLRK